MLFTKKAKVIKIDVDPEKQGKRHSVDVSILADAKKSLRALIDAGEAREESPLYKAALADREEWDAWIASFADDHLKDEGPRTPRTNLGCHQQGSRRQRCLRY